MERTLHVWGQHPEHVEKQLEIPASPSIDVKSEQNLTTACPDLFIDLNAIEESFKKYELKPRNKAGRSREDGVSQVQSNESLPSPPNMTRSRRISSRLQAIKSEPGVFDSDKSDHKNDAIVTDERQVHWMGDARHVSRTPPNYIEEYTFDGELKSDKTRRKKEEVEKEAMKKKQKIKDNGNIPSKKVFPDQF